MSKAVLKVHSFPQKIEYQQSSMISNRFYRKCVKLVGEENWIHFDITKEGLPKVFTPYGWAIVRDKDYVIKGKNDEGIIEFWVMDPDSFHEYYDEVKE